MTDLEIITQIFAKIPTDDFIINMKKWEDGSFEIVVADINDYNNVKLRKKFGACYCKFGMGLGWYERVEYVRIDGEIELKK